MLDDEVEMYKKVITMTTWRRPQYTKQVIDNLKKCIGFEEYILLPTVEPGYPEVLKAFDGISNCEIVVNDKRLGCSTNTFKALKRGFKISDFVIHLEDDTVPGIDSLKYFEWVCKTYKDDKDIFTGCAYNKTKNIDPENYFSTYRLCWFTPWMWCTWIDRFEEMDKGWDPNSFGPNINHKIRKDRYEIRPCIARSQNIGEHSGAYNDPTLWRQRQYNPVWINSIPDISFENIKYMNVSGDFRVNKNGMVYMHTPKIDETKDFVTEGYRKILLRNPDPGGFKLYVNNISSGRMTKEKFLHTLRTSEEYKSKKRILDKHKSLEGGEKLNLGCGTFKIPGYKNIDIRKDVDPDIIIDIEKVPYQFDEKSIDEILARDLVEHISFTIIEKVIKEWYRILKIGGRLIIQTPDFDKIISFIKSRNIKKWKDVSWHIYGEQDHSNNYHKLIFTKEELKSFLESSGFRVDNIYDDNLNIVCEATKL